MFGKYNYESAVGLQNSGKYAEAIKKYNKALTSGDLGDPDYYNALLFAGRCFISLDDNKSAIEYLHKAIDDDPNCGLAYYELGRAYIYLKDYDNALFDLNKSIDLNSDKYNLFLSWMMKGLSLREMQIFDDSIESFKQSLEYARIVAPDRTEEIKQYILESTIGNHLKIGLDFKNQNEFEEAIREFDYVLSLESGNDEKYDLHIYKGECLKELKKYADALSEFDVAISIDSKRSIAYSEKGDLYFELHKHSEACKYYEESLKRESDNGSVLINLAISQFLSGNLESGKITYEKAIIQLKSINESESDTSIKLLSGIKDLFIGLSLGLQNKYEEALQHFNKSLEKDKDNIISKLGMGIILLKLNKYNEAFPYIDECLKNLSTNLILSSMSSAVYECAGAVNLKLGNYEIALNYLNKSLSEDETDGDSWYYKGETHFAVHQYSEALSSYKKAIENYDEMNDIDIPTIESKIKITNEIIEKEKSKTIPSHITIQGNNNPINLGGILATDDAIINRSSVTKEDEDLPNFCSQCGKKIDSDSKFCKYCGVKLN